MLCKLDLPFAKVALCACLQKLVTLCVILSILLLHLGLIKLLERKEDLLAAVVRLSNIDTF